MNAKPVSSPEPSEGPIRLALEVASDRERSLDQEHIPVFAWNRPVASWSDLLLAAAQHYGIASFTVRKSLRQVLDTVSHKSPWIIWIPGDGEISGWVVLRDKWGRKLRVVVCRDKANYLSVTLEDFMVALGVKTQDEGIDWVGIDSVHSHADAVDEDKVGHARHHGNGHNGNGHSGNRHSGGGHDVSDHGEHHHATPMDRIRQLFEEERSTLWVIVIYSVAIGLLSLSLPIAVQALVNTVAFGTVLQPLVVLTLIVLVVLCFAGVLTVMRSYVVEIMQRRLFARIAADVMHKLLHVRKDTFDHIHGPELVNRFFDIVTVQKAASFLLIDGLAIVTSTVIGLVLLGFYHPMLLVFDLILLLSIAFVLWPLGRGAVPTAIDESRAKYRLAAWLEELARNSVTFKSPDGLSYAFSTTDELVTTWSIHRKSHFRILFRQIIGTVAIQAIFSAALLGFGGWLVIERQLTLGQLVASELIVTLVVSSFAKFGKQLETFYDLIAAADKVGHLIDLPLEEEGHESTPDTWQPASLQLSHISYGYPTRRKVLDELNLEVKSGERVGIIGLGSSGKSTLVDILYGLRQPTTGRVLLDDLDYRQIRLGDLRTHIALVREIEIFEGTIADNIRLGNPDITSRELRKILAQVGILEAVEALPQGIETMLMTGGRPLSPRQSVALMVARAIVCQPRLLIVDEDFVALDDIDCEADLVNVLADRNQPWTLILIAHASSLRLIADRCDALYFMESGKLRPVVEEDFRYSL